MKNDENEFFFINNKRRYDDEPIRRYIHSAVISRIRFIVIIINANDIKLTKRYRFEMLSLRGPQKRDR